MDVRDQMMADAEAANIALRQLLAWNLPPDERQLLTDAAELCEALSESQA